MQQKLPKGFVPVMISTFKEDHSLDLDGIARLTEMYIQTGSVGLFANCLSSEMYELTRVERLSLIETVVKTAAGRVPVVATGTLGDSIEEMADFSRAIYALGVDAVIVLNNLMVKEEESDAEFLKHMHRFMDLTPGIPFGIYECPVPYKRLISQEVLEDLLPSGRLVYHKDTSLDLAKVALRIRTAQGYNFGLYDAYMGHAVSVLKAGAMGLSCIQGNYFPELIVWLCENFNTSGKEEQVDIVQKFFIDHMDVMHTVYPTSAKYVLQKRGFPIRLATRRDVGKLTPKETSALDQLIESYLKLPMVKTLALGRLD
ncbi:dihydrodipicolinate synthase family protein [Aquirufa rosea]|uniref:Dihydrodipicolinate synthase family protein n=2 Tax=Aquirufa rosea TaxID=2509241 RepID=A0A4Q1BZM3_9BACT|nr:dihydrodipicolinate synthase family protein [Aquirufa rosea]